MTERPQHGARIVLDLVAETPEVHYAVTIFLPDVELAGKASIREDGSVTLAFDVAPPEWTLRLTRAFLRSAVLAKKDDPTERWPSRIVRWRSA